MPTVDLGLVVGSNGQGVPTGGSAGQILAKNSSSNYDTGWVPMSAAAAAAFGIVENGNAASQTISKGQYVIWKGVLYTADAAIASGTTLAASGGNKNLTAVPNGGLNALNSNIANALGGIKMKYITTNVTIADGSASSPSAVIIDLTNYLPENAIIVGISAFLGAYSLPYATPSGVMSTWIQQVYGHNIRLVNTATNWGVQAFHILAFYY